VSNIIHMNNQGTLMPQTMSELMRLAELLSQSDMVPKDYRGKPANIFVAIQWGAELGLAPLQSLQNIAPINGRPSIWGDAMLALVQGSGLLKAFKETIEGTGDSRITVCFVQRKGFEPQVRKFSVEDAKRANLWGKVSRDGKPSTWVQYPERMLQMRARGFALRDNFADVLRGMSMAEEVLDIPVDVEDITPQPELKGPMQIEAPKNDLATEDQKEIIKEFCAKAKFSNRDFGEELYRDFNQTWPTMTEIVAAQMIERLGERIKEMEATEEYAAS
jgi:hypothetical protein